MKEFTSINKPLGADGNFKAAAGLDGAMLIAKIEVGYPVEKLLSPILDAGDKLVDKIEALIPGDQKAMAQAAKEDFRAAIMKLITEQTQAQSLSAPALDDGSDVTPSVEPDQKA